MDSNNTIFSMEANLLQAKIHSWYTNTIGRDIQFFKEQSSSSSSSSQATKQEDIIQTILRFTNCLMASLDITGELINYTPTIKFLLANTLRMIEYKAKATKTTTEDPSSFTPFMRKRVTASLGLFRFLVSSQYAQYKSAINAKQPIRTEIFQQLGSDALYTWGESLVAFAECSLRCWKPQCILITISYYLFYNIKCHITVSTHIF